MIVEFICGCEHEINPADYEDIGWWKEVSMDREGFLVCVTHRVRRAHWASLPEGVSSQFANWKFGGFTQLEIERHLIFGEPLPVRSLKLEEAVEDRRDNRDPEEIGRELLAASAAKGNGHE